MASPLGSKQIFLTVAYHDIFSYPLTSNELKRWAIGSQFSKSARLTNVPKVENNIMRKKSYYHLAGRGPLIKKRLEREQYSQKKLLIAKKAANLLQRIPTILFVGITGSLAMQNSTKASDIDFLIITKQSSLWLSRVLTISYLIVFGFKVRRARDSNEEDKLCLNMWLDENDLYFDQHNLFTAHEIAQIEPLVNKNRIYERLISNNKWLFDYWPKAVDRNDFTDSNSNLRKVSTNPITNLIESLAYRAQRMYMRGKVSREVVTATRAFFHPFDWGEKALKEFEARGVSKII